MLLFLTDRRPLHGGANCNLRTRPASAQEMASLLNYISDRLEKNFRRTVFAAPGSMQQVPGLHRPAGGFGRRVAQY